MLKHPTLLNAVPLIMEKMASHQQNYLHGSFTAVYVSFEACELLQNWAHAQVNQYNYSSI